MLGPALEDMAVKAGGVFRLVKVNSDNERPVSAALEITALPTVFGVRDGKIVHMFQGMPKSEDMMKNFMMGLFGAAPFSPPVTAEESEKYEELTAKLIKTASAASFSFSAREKLFDRITSHLDALVEDDSVADVEDSATLVRTLINNIIRNPYEQKYRRVNLSNSVISSKIGEHKKCLAILKSVGFSLSKSDDGSKKEMVLHNGKKVINVAPLIVARDCIDKWIQANRKAMAAAARRHQDEIDRKRLQAEAEAAALEAGDAEEEVEEEEAVDPTACNLKLRLDGKKKVHEVVLHQDDPLRSILDSLSIDSDGDEVQITCVAKRLVVKSSDEEAMAKSLGEHGLMPSAAIVVSTSSSRASAESSSSSLKERAAAKKKKTGSHTMQSIGIYAKDDNNKAELIDGGGGVWYEHDVSEDEEEGNEGGEGEAEGASDAGENADEGEAGAGEEGEAEEEASSEE